MKKQTKHIIVIVVFFASLLIFYCKKNTNTPQNGSHDNFNFNPHHIDLNFAGIHYIKVFDLDGDGDSDIIGGSETTSHSQSRGLAWWRNDGGNPINWRRFTVDANFEHVMSVNVGYVDNDIYPDIVATSWSLHQIVWWKNSGNPTSNWTKNVVRSNFINAHDAKCFDINQDGYTDIAGISSSGQLIVCYNTGSDSPGWDIQTLNNSFSGGKSLMVLDIDQDGDTDIIGTAADANKITWWENQGGNPVNWTSHIIDNFNGSTGIDIIDLNNDGLYDVIGASYKSNEVSYWICEDMMSSQWTKTMITNDLDIAILALGNDLDRDNDMDIVAIGKSPGELNIYENRDFNWIKHTLKTNFEGGSALALDDLDNDGDMDIIAGASGIGQLYWWENNSNSQ